VLNADVLELDSVRESIFVPVYFKEFANGCNDSRESRALGNDALRDVTKTDVTITN